MRAASAPRKTRNQFIWRKRKALRSGVTLSFGDVGRRTVESCLPLCLRVHLGVFLDVLQYPHTDEGCCAYAFPLCLSPYFLKGIRIKTNRNTLGEIFSEANTHGLVLV